MAMQRFTLLAALVSLFAAASYSQPVQTSGGQPQTSGNQTQGSGSQTPIVVGAGSGTGNMGNSFFGGFGLPTASPVAPTASSSKSNPTVVTNTAPPPNAVSSTDQKAITPVAGGAPVDPGQVQAQVTAGPSQVSVPQVVSQSQLPPLLPETQANPEAMTHQQQAVQLFQSGDAAGAQKQIQKALAAAPDDPQLQALDNMITQHVDNPWQNDALKKKADDLMTAQSAGSSGGTVEAGVVGWPGAGAAAGRSLVFTRTDPGEAQTVSQIHDLFGLKDFTGALRLLDAELAKHPQDGTLWALRAAAKRGDGDLTGAISDATQALALNPADGFAYKVRSYAESDLKRFEPAFRDANDVLKLNGNDGAGYAARALAEKGLGLNDESLADLQKAAELDPQEFANAYAAASQAAGKGGVGNFFRHFPVGEAASAGGGLGLLALALVLLFGRTGLTTLRSRAPMRRADRAVAEPSKAPKGFELVRQVGRGGMGEVYEAMDLALQRRVAVKRMRPEIAADARERKRFIKEARTVASLKHPNIIEIHSVVEDNDDLFLVFEYLPGETLDRILAGRGRLPVPEALARSREIAAALDYAHAEGVVHQDLKPANVIVSPHGAKVMDFGIARRVQETLSTLSRAEVVGTPAYMAPEQERGEFLKESDIYALGLCAYEMLSGGSAFRGGTSYMLKAEGKFAPLSSSAPWLPGSVDGAIAKALAPDPAQRYRSAGAFVADLEAALKTAPQRA